MIKKDRFQLVGNTIAGTFRVDEVVAEGGFGIVYRAYHLHFRSPVALKCLKIPKELTEEERQTFLEQFRSEAEIQFRLSSALPHIVRPLHVDAVHTDEGEFVPIMALEWLDGQSFEKIIEHRTFADMPPMPLGEAMELIGPAAQALDEAHHFQVGGETLSVIHRDVKPDNFFVTEMGGKKTVKLLDFGISKVRRAATQLAGHFSQTGGQAPFSPAYGAPEQWVPKRFGQTGPWTDVWGLALTLVEIIKGDAVIVGDHQAMMGTVLDPNVRPSPRSEGVAVSDEVESVFLKALAVDPRYRYQSVRSFWEALSAALALSSSAGFEETPSGRRIALPRMSAPTPWTPPHRHTDVAQADAHLPPMLAPAPLEPTPDSQQEAPAYPSNPHSDLQPVPPAPSTWTQMDVDIPPIFDPEERLEPQDDRRTLRLSHPPRPRSHPAHALSLELAPTSNFPTNFEVEDASVDEGPPPDPAYAPDVYVPPALGGFSLPATVTSGAPIKRSSPTNTRPEAAPEFSEAPAPPGVESAPREDVPAAATSPASRSQRPPPPQRSARSTAGSAAPVGSRPPPPPRPRDESSSLPPIPDLTVPGKGSAAPSAHPDPTAASTPGRPGDRRPASRGPLPPTGRSAPPVPRRPAGSQRASGHAPSPPQAPPRPTSRGAEPQRGTPHQSSLPRHQRSPGDGGRRSNEREEASPSLDLIPADRRGGFRSS